MTDQPNSTNSNSDSGRENGEIKRHFGTEGNPNGNGKDDQSTGLTMGTTTRRSAPPRPIKYDETLVAHHDRGSAITEEYRAIRTHLSAACPAGRFACFVTSAEAGEGKTTTAANLALVLGERPDRRTILIDANLRNGELSSLLNAPSQPGLAELLHGQATLEQVTQATACPNLFYVPAGRLANGPGGQLLGSELKDLVAELRRQYDHVLFDTPALHSGPDASIVGAADVDALLVVRMYRTRRESIAKAIRGLNGASVKVAGIILNEQKFFIPKALYQSL